VWSVTSSFTMESSRFARGPAARAALRAFHR
jgi:hypothetical protein